MNHTKTIKLIKAVYDNHNYCEVTIEIASKRRGVERFRGAINREDAIMLKDSNEYKALIAKRRCIKMICEANWISYKRAKFI